MIEVLSNIDNYIEKAYLDRKKKLENWISKHELKQIQWEATRKCDMMCVYCGSSCSSKSSIKELSSKEIISVFKDISQSFDPAAIELIAITGGEPLIRKDILDIIFNISSLGFKHITIQTNGNFLAKNPLLIDSLVTSGLTGIGLNVDGPSNIHDSLKGENGHFFKIYELAKELKSRGDLYLSITTVINKLNLNYINEITEIINDIKPGRWRLLEIQPIGRAYNNKELLLGHLEFKYLVDYVSALTNTMEDSIDIELGCTGWLGKNLEGFVRPYIWHCHAGISSVGIYSDGAIGGCVDINKKFSVGNIRKDSIKNLWDNGFNIYRDLSSRKNGLCSSCKEWELCHGGSMHLRDEENNLLQCPYQLYYCDFNSVR